MNRFAFLAVFHIFLAVIITAQWDHEFNEPLMFGYMALLMVAGALFFAGFYNIIMVILTYDERFLDEDNDICDNCSDYTPTNYDGINRNDHRSSRLDQL